MRALLIGLAIAAGVWLVAILVLVAVGRRSRARELATLLPNLLFLFRGLLRDPRVPRGAKLWVGFAVLWIVSPIDLIPEFIPVVGPLDDAIVAALVLRHLLRRTDRSVLADHWRGDASTLDALAGRA
ncbi:MAG: YkvA family protein [Actinomycetota bacterium]